MNLAPPRGNYNDWKRGQHGGGQGRQGEPPGLPPKPRESWCLVDPKSGVAPTLFFGSKAEAEASAAVLRKKYDAAYEVQEVDQSEPLRPEGPVLDGAVPDPVKDLMYRLLQTGPTKYSVSAKPDSLFCYLTFLVRDAENKDSKISVEMSKSELLHLAEYLFASLVRRRVL